MKYYILTQPVRAIPMSRIGYNNYRGWELPQNENALDSGYFITFESGYETWMEKTQFESVYKEIQL